MPSSPMEAHVARDGGVLTMATAPGEWRPEMLLNILRCTERPATENGPAPNVTAPRLRTLVSPRF